ncbi:hypothetical protein [Ulvibacterium marinum]|uniref:hypothetical protein n=1 Tax=Ulvibacterium marinum TaxID=2419782 RepID=UPI002495265B|nr:hypothetical protein [Ulvibacterium marinum]
MLALALDMYAALNVYCESKPVLLGIYANIMGLYPLISHTKVVFHFWKGSNEPDALLLIVDRSLSIWE